MNKMTKFVLSPYYWIKALDSIEQGNDLDAYYFLNNMHVITSYSIHYTKLYEPVLLDKGVRFY